MSALIRRDGIHAGQMRGVRVVLGVALLLFALILAALLATGSASAEETPGPPPYDGAQTFPTIRGASYAEDYSWTVALQPGQKLVQVDDQTVEVQFAEGHRASTIAAEAAHDANGVTVPTTIAVTAPEVITLTVHHRAGNPAEGGAPFAYPITAGAGWEGGWQTVIVTGPPDEAELRARREREEAAARLASPPAPVTPETVVPHCLVPKLKGLSLPRSRHRLRAADCRVGTVGRAGGVSSSSGRVVEQGSKPGRSLGAGTAVDLRLG